MKKILTGAAVVLLTAPTVLLAGGPDNPGVFGTDRAAWLEANSGKEWGVIAKDRAGEKQHAEMNQTYKTANGGDPNPENDNGGGNDDE